MDEPLAGKSTLNRMEPVRHKGPSTRDHVRKDAMMNCCEGVHRVTPQAPWRSSWMWTLPNCRCTQAGGTVLSRLLRQLLLSAAYIFCGEHVLCARLREADHDAAFGRCRKYKESCAIRAACRPQRSLSAGIPALPQPTD